MTEEQKVRVLAVVEKYRERLIAEVVDTDVPMDFVMEMVTAIQESDDRKPSP